MSDKYELIKIEKPILPKPVSWGLMHDSYRQEVASAENPEYLYWEKIKRKKFDSSQDNLTIWANIKYSRKIRSKHTPITTPDGQNFVWVQCAHYEEVLHNFTQSLSGYMVSTTPHILDDKEKEIYITRGLVEEAIASSQLEGANTSRAYAKKMITESIPPHDNSQRMIVNNYRAMQKIEEYYKHKKMSLERLNALHEILTKDGAMDQGEAGRFRTDEDEIVINAKWADGKVAHIPPKMEFVEKEILRLIDFANDELDVGFIHPVIKAIMLHFWIGYLHPYADGNGRLARVMFYWYLLRKGYWMFAFMPISEAIKTAPTQYGWAYIYSEQDDYDLTYFLDYNLRKILQAQKSFEEYLVRKKKENEQIVKTANRLDMLNIRQVKIAQFLKTHKGEATNVSAVTTLFGVSQMTAIRDLKDMEAQGLLIPKRKGRNVFYHPTEKLLRLMEG